MKEKKDSTIATIEINWAHATNPREEFLEDYLHCPLCGDELLYTHVTHFVHGNVSEEAHCNSCKIKTKSNHHPLQ